MNKRRHLNGADSPKIAVRPSRRLPRGTIAVTAAAALASTVTLAGSASIAATGRAAAIPRCPTSGLVIWLGTTGNGAAGSIYYSLYLTNLSRRACTVRGYPSVSAVDLAGRQVGRVATRETGTRPATLTLAPGATATAVLRVTNAANYSSSVCHEVTAAGLRVYPPGQVASKLVPFPFKTCSRAVVASLSVRALR
jgi:Domain of unknown function (DUF4232)